MDRDYADNESDPAHPRFEHALFVKSQVMSVGARHAVVDAGHKSHAVDSGLPRVHDPVGSAPTPSRTPATSTASCAPAEGAALPELGETIWLVPGHCDPTVNLYDRYLGVRGGLAEGRVERVIEIDARGAVT